MTIPYTMPVRGIAAQEFEPQRFDAGAPERGGRLGGITLGWPLWSAEWTLSSNMTGDASDEWRAFILRLRGSQRVFLGYDRDRVFPKTYSNGFAGLNKASGGAFSGACATWSQVINAAGDAVLSLTDLPAAFVIGVGDYIGFKWDAIGSAANSFDRRTLSRVLTGAVSNGSGAASVTIEPPISGLVVPAFAIAHLDKPLCRMKLVPGQTQLGPMGVKLNISGGKIMALQDMRR